MLPKYEKLINYDLFSKSRGYLCSTTNEDLARKHLADLYKEHKRYWSAAESNGDKVPNFDCSCICRQGHRTWTLGFDTTYEEESQYE